MKADKRTICVFAASSADINRAYVDAAGELGALMAAHGWKCANGAGATGLMRAVTDAMLDNGGRVVGVIPKFMVDNGWCHDRLEEVVITADMHDRKRQLADMSDAVIALPGGCGTLEELLEAITWRQLGLQAKPIVLLNTRGFFTPLLGMLDECVRQGFMRQSHSRLWTVADTPRQALEAVERELEQGVPAAEPKLRR